MDAKELYKKIEQGIIDCTNSDKYKTYLKIMSRFSSYSSNNIMLISLQMPNATHLAGATAWKSKFERHVKKGEKGICILAPLRKKSEETDDEGSPVYKLVGFRVVHVFDISQTEGKPLPQLTTELIGDVSNFDTILEALKNIASIPVTCTNDLGTAYGAYSSINKCIYLRNGLGQMQQIKTLIHEIAHSRLHSDNQTGVVPAEVEAESVAYTVCSYLGIDTGEYSFGYITAWSSGDTEILQKSFSRIHKTAKRIISELEKELNHGR